MKIKILALLMILALALCCFVSCGGNEKGSANSGNGSETGSVNGNPEIYKPVTGGTLKVEGEIADGILTVKVKVINNPGIAGFNFKLGFDKTMLRPVELLDSDVASADAYLSNLSLGADVVPTLDILSAQYVQPGNFIIDGYLVVANFEILEGASGETKITLDASDITDQFINDMEFIVEELTVNLD